MRTFKLFLFSFMLLVLSSGVMMAQTCLNGKTAFIWVNGIMEPNASTWAINTSVAGLMIFIRLYELRHLKMPDGYSWKRLAGLLG